MNKLLKSNHILKKALDKYYFCYIYCIAFYITSQMNQYQIISIPRHKRYIYFLPHQIDHQRLFNIILDNQLVWGGQFNPIVPVVDGVISLEYLTLIKHYDPDVIFYTSDIDIQIIKNLKLFNPLRYCNIDKDNYDLEQTSIHSFHLLMGEHLDRGTIFTTQLDQRFQNTLLPFYQINYCLIEQDIRVDLFARKSYQMIDIDEENFENINTLILQHKPINIKELSSLKSSTNALSTDDDVKIHSNEIIIANDEQSNSDLWYYWNRHLYEHDQILFITKSQLILLSQDIAFVEIVSDLCTWDSIEVKSFSINKLELKQLLNDCFGKYELPLHFRISKTPTFPFRPTSPSPSDFQMAVGSKIVQSIISDRGLYLVPDLNFDRKIENFYQSWMTDVLILKHTYNGSEKVCYPSTTDPISIFKTHSARIILTHDVSLEVNTYSPNNSIHVEISSFVKQTIQLICLPRINCLEQKTKYHSVKIHDSSNKLTSFVALFNNNFSVIDQLFTNKFWVEIFEKLSSNNRAAGDAIRFKEIVDSFMSTATNYPQLISSVAPAIPDMNTISHSLMQTLQHLVKCKVFLQGYTLKCQNCSSVFWYSMPECSHSIECKGCIQPFDFPVEAKFSYRLNDLVKKNIFRTIDDRDGNLTVIRTLAHFSHLSSNNLFQYCPQLELINDTGKIVGDLDIVCNVNGKFIIGEAKHSSNLFKENANKSLNSLLDAALEFKPDKIVLSCYTDERNALKKALNYMKHKMSSWQFQPELIAISLDSPSYKATLTKS